MQYYYLIDDSKPFRGFAKMVFRCESVDAARGLAAEYEAANPEKSLRLVYEDKFFTLVGQFEESLITAPLPITEAEYTEALEVLPPCRWHNVAGFSVFHSLERLTGKLVNWYATSSGKYWVWIDYDNTPDEDLATKLREINTEGDQLMTMQAQIAIYAAQHVHQWGHFAARRYAMARGVSPRLYRIARQCEALYGLRYWNT